MRPNAAAPKRVRSRPVGSPRVIWTRCLNGRPPATPPSIAQSVEAAETASHDAGIVSARDSGTAKMLVRWSVSPTAPKRTSFVRRPRSPLRNPSRTSLSKRRRRSMNRLDADGRTGSDRRANESDRRAGRSGRSQGADVRGAQGAGRSGFGCGPMRDRRRSTSPRSMRWPGAGSRPLMPLSRARSPRRLTRRLMQRPRPASKRRMK